MSVEEAVSAGLQNSRALHSALMGSEAADAKSSEVNALRLPTVKLGGVYTRLSEVPPSEIGPYPPLFNDKIVISPSIFDNYNLRLSLQQPIFTGFRLQSSADIADYSARAAEQDYAKARSELIYSIRNAYWNLYKAIEFKKVVDENVEQVKSHLNDVKNLAAQGLLMENEALKVEVQLSNVQVLQIDAQNNVRLATIGLNNLIGQPLTTEIEPSSSIPQIQANDEDLESYIKAALDQRPEVHRMEYQIKVSESGVTLARSGWYPQVMLTGNYYYARPNQRIFPAEDKFTDTWDVNLSLSLDIWNWGTTIHQTHQAQAQLAQAQDAYAQVRDGISLEVTQSYLNLRESKERVAVAEKGAGQAEENYRITHEKFKSGLVLNSDLLDAEAALLQARWNRIQSLVDHAVADAKLREAIGNEVAALQKDIHR
jgi:outer membrane protein